MEKAQHENRHEWGKTSTPVHIRAGDGLQLVHVADAKAQHDCITMPTSLSARANGVGLHFESIRGVRIRQSVHGRCARW